MKKITIISIISLSILCVVGLYIFFQQKNIINVQERAVAQSPKDFLVEEYPLNESPIFNQLDDKCEKDLWLNEVDARITRNGVEIVSSLLNLIASHYGYTPNCGQIKSFSIFSAPDNGDYLYISTTHISKGGNGEERVYSLFLPKLQINDLYQTVHLDRFKLLSDKKRVIVWDNDVSLVDLQSGKIDILFKIPNNKTIQSKISDCIVSDCGDYDIKIINDSIFIGIYSEIINGISVYNALNYIDYQEQIIEDGGLVLDFEETVVIKIPDFI